MTLFSSFSSTINSLSERDKTILFSVVALLGFTLRMLCAYRGFNWDMESWYVVANIADSGANVYASTNRYNYGIIWFNVLHLLKSISFIELRYAIAIFLSFIDIAIAVLLFRSNYLFPAIFYLLSPIVIIITGYHCQIENLCILFALMAVLYLEKKGIKNFDHFEKMTSKDIFVFCFLLSLSLISKHLFIFFPLWLSVKIRNVKAKALVLLLPVILFFGSFLFYAGNGALNGIIENVFHYDTFRHCAFTQTILPAFVNNVFKYVGMETKAPRILFFYIMIFLSFVFRRKNILETFLLYLLCLNTFISNNLNEYYTISVLYIAFFPSFLGILYSLYGALFLIVANEGLHYNLNGTNTIVNMINSNFSYDILSILLFLIFIQSFIHLDVKKYIDKILNAIFDSISIKF